VTTEELFIQNLKTFLPWHQQKQQNFTQWKDKLMKNESGIVPFPWCIKKLVQMLYSSSQAIALK
jgi:hypothetical protein